jgi:hypothetical protein
MPPLRFPVIATIMLAALAGCSSSMRHGTWPSLAPRPGEMSPMVPRTPLGSHCGGCGADMVGPAPTVAAPPAPPPPVPADAEARLAAVAAAIAEVDRRYPALRRVTDAALAARRGDAADRASEAEVQRSRLEALFTGLSAQARALDGLEDDLVGTSDSAALAARIAALRTELARLEALRQSLPGAAG